MQTRSGALRPTQVGGSRFPFGFRTAGEIAEPALRHMCSPSRLTLIRVIREWDRIAGSELAACCRPLRIRTHAGRTVLHICANGAWATEIAYRMPTILERINTACGAGTIDDIRITQVGAAESPATATRKGVPVLATASRSINRTATDPEVRRRTVQTLASVSDPDLRAALGRLHLALQFRDQNPQHRRPPT